MSGAIPAASLEQYLNNSAYEHCEYVDGEIVGRHAGNRDHSRIQIRLGRKPRSADA